MPSIAYDKFHNDFIIDVQRLIDSYNKLNPNGRGRRTLDHLTRSGVVMLCAAWERYLELLVIQSVNFMAENISLPNDLPKEVQKEISCMVKEHKHELKPLELAGDGWKIVYRNHAELLASQLNSPNCNRVDKLFMDLLGIPSISEQWSIGRDAINDFVILRGSIAHKGQEMGYLPLETLKKYYDQVKQTAQETDIYLQGYLQNITGSRAPWYRPRKQS